MLDLHLEGLWFPFPQVRQFSPNRTGDCVSKACEFVIPPKQGRLVQLPNFRTFA
jgi:hypothetical protein